MPEVARVVVGLLERAQDEARESARAAALAGDPRLDELGGLPHDLGGLLGSQMTARERWGRNAERGQLLDQPLGRRAVGALVDAKQRRDVSTVEKLGHLLVGRDHQMLDQAMRFGLGYGGDRHYVAVVVEAELWLG